MFLDDEQIAPHLWQTFCSWTGNCFGLLCIGQFNSDLIFSYSSMGLWYFGLFSVLPIEDWHWQLLDMKCPKSQELWLPDRIYVFFPVWIDRCNVWTRGYLLLPGSRWPFGTRYVWSYRSLLTCVSGQELKLHTPILCCLGISCQTSCVKSKKEQTLKA